MTRRKKTTLFVSPDNYTNSQIGEVERHLYYGDETYGCKWDWNRNNKIVQRADGTYRIRVPNNRLQKVLDVLENTFGLRIVKKEE